MLSLRLEVAPWATALVLATACTPGDTSVHIEHAALTRDVLGADAAAYFTVRADDTRPDSIAGVSLAEAQLASLQSIQPHRAVVGANAVMMMPVGPIPIGPSRTVRLVPGGYTGMIYGLRRSLAPGDSVRLTVRFTSGRTATVLAPVLAFADLEAALDPTSVGGRPVTAPTATDGAHLYRANGCASCHGAEGRGDGPVGRMLVPPPRDFRHSTAFKGGTAVERIARTLAIGVPAGGAMPLYAHLSNHERRALALYLLSLRTPTTERTSTP